MKRFIRLVSIALVALSLLTAAGLAAAAPAADDTVILHVVTEGETLADIAIQYGISTTQLMWANDITDPDLIYEGMELRVPGSSTTDDSEVVDSAPIAPTPAGYYVVQYGDTLSNIARRLGVSARELARLNDIAYPDGIIFTGQNLVVPGGSIDTPTSEPVREATAKPSDAQPPQVDHATSAPPAATETPEPRCANPYTVRKGDTLAAIAAECEVSKTTLMKLNGMLIERVFAGQQLYTREAITEPLPSTLDSNTPEPAGIPILPVIRQAAPTHPPQTLLLPILAFATQPARDVPPASPAEPTPTPYVVPPVGN